MTGVEWAGFQAYLAGFLINATIYTLFVLGLNLQFGYTGLINFGHVAFMGIGAYTMGLLSKVGVTLWLAVPAGMAAAALFGVLISMPSLRLREDYLAIVTVGAAEIVRMVLNNETWLTGGPYGLRGFAIPFDTWGVNPLTYRWLLLGLFVLLTAAVFWVLQYLLRSPWGRVLKAIREDEEAAISLGKNTRRYKIQAFVIGGAIAGLAGSLLAFYLRFVEPLTFNPLTSFVGWMIMVLGGVANNWGAVLGSLVYFGIFSLTRSLESSGLGALTGAQVGALRFMVIGAALVALMMFRPQGILGRKEELSLDR